MLIYYLFTMSMQNSLSFLSIDLFPLAHNFNSQNVQLFEEKKEAEQAPRTLDNPQTKRNTTID